MKKLLLFVVGLCCLCFWSCGTNGSEKNGSSNDTVFDDSIQGVFYGTPFGASREELVKNFEENGFVIDPVKPVIGGNMFLFDESQIRFLPIEGNSFSFGGKNWELLRVNFVDEKFFDIEFVYYDEDKASAISSYESILSELSKKYKITEETPEDTIFYKRATVLGKDKRKIVVDCHRYESIGLFHAVSLSYSDDSFDNVDGDES